MVSLIGDDVAAALPELRAQAESLMRDEVLIERPSGSTLDPVTLQKTAAWSRVWSGMAKYRRPRTTSQDPTVAGAEFVARSVEVCIPWDQSGDIRSGDRVTLVSSLVPRHEEPLTVRAVSVPTLPVQAVLSCERAVRDGR